ncbi:hypothetical protein DXT99_09020 [Pontibacter diazotrophicus]|uniref:TonB C-terminal domain-containing protein n=1 Tax=Pontibacter diazotrophicus TaxID=1400979 RepID=A0A3D8LEB1_9BACT|nr:energy transducer TonB [Pontibacter diazotrophicus]RDV15614.1 hypothetical protein DXT99_09020 [Pontibacter diazotrophicus]
MKQTLLLIALVLCPLLTFAQQEDEYRPVVIHYNAQWQVTKPEAAVVKRLAYLPANIKHIKDLNAPEFIHGIKDYYANDTMLARGHYNERGEKWATWSFYYPNGQLDCQGKFDRWKLVGEWRFWWPDGKPMMEVYYGQDYDLIMRNCWNQQGDQTVRDGNGSYAAVVPDENGVDMLLKGSYQNGYQAGEWTYGPEGGNPIVRQKFGEKGKVLEGVMYAKGKVKKKYTSPNRLRVEPEPENAGEAERWIPDPAFYEKGYPVVADVLSLEVQKVEVDKKLKSVTNHYYNIIQRFEGGADTTVFGAPVVLPVFKRNVQSFISTHYKFPEHLRNQHIQGIMVATFLVDKEGVIKDPIIIKSLDPALDEAYLKMINKMPAWQPGTVNGKPAEMLMTLPLRIKGSYIVAEHEGFGGRRGRGRNF